METGVFQELVSGLIQEYQRVCTKNDELHKHLIALGQNGDRSLDPSENHDSIECLSQPPPSEPQPPPTPPPTLPLSSAKGEEDVGPQGLQENAIPRDDKIKTLEEKRPSKIRTPTFEQGWLAVAVPGEIPHATTHEETADMKDPEKTPLAKMMTSHSSCDSRVSFKSNFEDIDPTRPFSWQWQHRTGFRDYDRNANKRIEEAYQRGESKVRLKTGKKGTTPMEIFFADMVQFDPSSKNTRVIRRVGNESWLARLQRTIQSYLRAFETGQPRYESCANYQIRRHALNASLVTFSLPKNKRSSGRHSLVHNPNASRCSRCCKGIAYSSFFSYFSPLLVLLNAIWIAVDIDRDDTALLYDADVTFQVIEHLFCALYVFDIFVRWFNYYSNSHALKDPWFCFDILVVILMVLETEVVPPLLALSDADADVVKSFDKVMARLRVLRLLRLTRFARLVGVGESLNTLLKGIAHAMRSVFLTMVLLFLLLYIFGVLFRVEAKDEHQFVSKFPSVVGSMVSLLLYGTFLDSPRILMMEDLEGYLVLQCCFLVFIFFSCFTLINMLVGILCQVAFEVSKAAKSEHEKSYLQRNLSGILECYDKDEENTIGIDEFTLLMNNPEVHEILVKFGTDPWLLRSLKDKLFTDPETMIDFAQLFQVISRLRGNHTAHVTDIVELREFIKAELTTMKKELIKISHWTSEHDDVPNSPFSPHRQLS